jgi:hypothetical protein
MAEALQTAALVGMRLKAVRDAQRMGGAGWWETNKKLTEWEQSFGYMGRLYMGNTAGQGPPTGLTPQGTSMGPGGIRVPGTLGQISTIKGAWADPQVMMKDAAVKCEELNFRERMFVMSMTAGVGQVANDVTQLWGQAFEDVFGKADNLLTNLLKRMTGTMVQMTIERAAFGLLGLIPGVGQLFGALGMGGPVGGGEGGEMFSNYGKAATRGGGVAGEIAALRQDLANGTWRVRGNDLALVTERGQQIRRGRTY